MTDALRTAATLLLGYLSAYGQQPTDATIQYRQATNQIPPNLAQYDGVIAVADCSLIGQHAILHTPHADLDVIIFDCAGRDGGLAWMLKHNILAEIDYYLWQKHPDIVHQKAALTIIGWPKEWNK